MIEIIPPLDDQSKLAIAGNITLLPGRIKRIRPVCRSAFAVFANGKAGGSNYRACLPAVLVLFKGGASCPLAVLIRLCGIEKRCGIVLHLRDSKNDFKISQKDDRFSKCISTSAPQSVHY